MQAIWLLMQRLVAVWREKSASYTRKDLFADMTAGLTGATAGAPQAMGFALVAGISPVYGLYTAIVSTIIGGVFGTSSLMTTGPTNALAVVVGSTLAPFTDSGDLVARLVTLTFLVGVIQIVFGLLRLGGLTRFVSGAVMTGFVTGAASLVMIGQFEHLTGLDIPGESLVPVYLFKLARESASINLETFVMGVVAIGIIIYLHHTRLSPFATLIAIIITGIAIALLGWDTRGVALVRDMSAIPSTLPGITLPSPKLVPDLASSALALAVLGLVQTIALVQSIPEPNKRKKPQTSREFFAQGLANVGGALFQNMPAGGSLSRTAINIKAEAHSRWSNIWAGIFVALLMMLFAGLVEQIALAALAGHLIVAGASLISPARIRFVSRAGWASRWAMIVTFASTWVLPLQYSVYVGIVLSLVLYIHQSSHLHMTCLEPADGGSFREVSVPNVLPDRTPVILSVQGHLFFAAMNELGPLLPDPDGAEQPVVILRVRGDKLLAGTGVSLLVSYAERLRAQGGQLILCGVGDEVMATLTRTGGLHKIGPENVFRADDVLLASTQSALAYAREWLAGCAEMEGDDSVETQMSVGSEPAPTTS